MESAVAFLESLTPAQLKRWRFTDENGHFDYEAYRSVQIAGNKRKINNSWAYEPAIQFLAQYLRKTRPTLDFGLCHGTRRGLEQAWFRDLLGCEVIGTEISDTASQFPHTVQWDFHDANPLWVGKADFVYSNSFDHSYDPALCFRTWAAQLKPDGLLLLEHTLDHGPKSIDPLDPFRIARTDFITFLNLLGASSNFRVRETIENFAIGPLPRHLEGLCYIIVERTDGNGPWPMVNFNVNPLAGLAKTRMGLADLFKARDVKRLHYFHCDHFEPWEGDDQREDIGSRNAELIENFAEATTRLDFARKLTLFYKVPLHYRLDPYLPGQRVSAADPVVFVPRAKYADGLARMAMQHLLSVVGHELQVHIHHENFTAHEGHPDPRNAAILNAADVRRNDGERLDIAVKTALDLIERETGQHLHDKWFFVHGLWALNGSDVKVCTIADEIEILMRNGCRGDFTFPAGRAHTNPRYEAPFLVKPLRALKGYDYPQAEPEPAWGGGDQKDKFFIWSSKVKHVGNSLDYYAPWLRAKLEDIEAHAAHIIENSFVIDGNIFIKTHAHSMHHKYRQGVRVPVVPHAHPGIQQLLCTIFDSASQAGLTVNFSTASEIFDLFAAAKPSAAPASMAAYTPETLARLPEPVAAYVPQVALAHVDQLDAAIRATMRDRIMALGERESGAYSHYAQLVQRGRVIQRHEEDTVRYILNHLPQVKLCHDIGTGLGTLAVLLAANGVAACGFEADKRRAASAQAVLVACKAALPELAPVTIVAGRFPDVADLAPAGADFAPAGADLAVTGDFIATMDAPMVTAVLRGLATYPAILIDMDRFIVRRTTDEARRTLIAEFADLGFGAPEQAFESSGSTFLLFRKVGA